MPGKKPGKKPPGTIDWTQIKTEYVTTDTTMDLLSKKHDISVNQIGQHAVKEAWTEERRKFREKTYKNNLKSAEKDEKARYKRVQKLADRLLDLLEQAVDSAADTGGVQSFRGFTVALKDIKEIQDLHCRLDEEEQTARIENLRRQNSGESQKQEITVKFDDVDGNFLE